MPYRDDLNAAHEEIERKKEEADDMIREIRRLKEKKMKEMVKVPRWIKTTALVVSLVFGYAFIGGLVSSWTERNFCPCRDKGGVIATGVFWPVGVLVNLGKYSYDLVKR